MYGKIRVIISNSYDSSDRSDAFYGNKTIYDMDSRENKHLNILVDNEVTKEQIYELSYLNYNGVYVRVDVYDDSEYLISYNNV